MPAARRYINWTGTSFTPAGGTLVPLTGVTNITIDPQGTNEKFSGDGDRFITMVANVMNEPMATIEFADPSALLGVPVGAVGTLITTLNDARNKTGTGAITYTIVNAVLRNLPVTGPHKTYAKNTLTVECYSPDGQTNPVSTSVAA